MESAVDHVNKDRAQPRSSRQPESEGWKKHMKQPGNKGHEATALMGDLLRWRQL